MEPKKSARIPNTMTPLATSLAAATTIDTPPSGSIARGRFSEMLRSSQQDERLVPARGWSTAGYERDVEALHDGRALVLVRGDEAVHALL
jgi:hypothetical protein